MNISVAILDKNEEYLEKINNELSKYNEVRLSLFSKKEAFDSALEKQRYDVVLQDGSLDWATVAGSKIGVIITLGDINDETAKKVLKYQRISQLYKSVLNIYAETAGSGINFGKGVNTRIVSVFSVSGGVGKSIVSYAMAQLLTQKGEKVLLANLEQLSSFAGIEKSESAAGDVPVLLSTIESNANFELKLRGIAKKSQAGFDYIEGFSNFIDYADVTYEDAKTLSSELLNQSEYSYIVIDLESASDQIAKAFIETSDYAVLVKNPKDSTFKKCEMFAKQKVYTDNVNKLLCVDNLIDNNVACPFVEGVVSMGGIPNMGNLPANKVVSQIVSKQYIDVQKVI